MHNRRPAPPAPLRLPFHGTHRRSVYYRWSNLPSALLSTNLLSESQLSSSLIEVEPATPLYNMNPEQNTAPKKIDSTVENAMHRSGYGDMHAHRDALISAEHIAFLRQHSMIDDTMAQELSKPNDRERKYTAEYLGTHPDYTGIQPEMTALSTADRHQKQRDKNMEKFVKDFEAGLIDENGDPNPAARYFNTEDDDSQASKDGNDTHKPEPYDPNAFLKLDTSLYRFSDPLEKESAESPMIVDYARSHNVYATSKQKSKSPSASSQASGTGTSSTLTRTRKPKYRVAPLQPLPGGEDYSQYNYYQLLAVCRERQIYSTGDTQEVRNRLIQDDINVAQGLPRDLAKCKRNLYKDFKTDVPDALKKAGEE